MTQMATALGAGYEPHLTDITTHLLATEPGSAKYRVSLERRIVIMSPEWVRDSHRIWLEGGSVDLKEVSNRDLHHAAISHKISRASVNIDYQYSLLSEYRSLAFLWRTDRDWPI